MIHHDVGRSENVNEPARPRLIKEEIAKVHACLDAIEALVAEVLAVSKAASPHISRR
jgi:hypothetical protein